MKFETHSNAEASRCKNMKNSSAWDIWYRQEAHPVRTTCSVVCTHGKEIRVVLLDHKFICNIVNTLDTF